MSRVVVWLIRLYQRLSRLLPPVCRFRPSCSEYAVQAIQTHGLCRGLLLAAWRILRCNPMCRGGDDPVPPRKDRSHSGEHC
ncbi:MAG: membrane protein insertion efficiency factor YidD [Armatimonadota bacterium]